MCLRARSVLRTIGVVSPLIRGFTRGMVMARLLVHLTASFDVVGVSCTAFDRLMGKFVIVTWKAFLWVLVLLVVF